jgi:hypothetical protein
LIWLTGDWQHFGRIQSRAGDALQLAMLRIALLARVRFLICCVLGRTRLETRDIKINLWSEIAAYGAMRLTVRMALVQRTLTQGNVRPKYQQEKRRPRRVRKSRLSGGRADWRMTG